MLDVIGSWNSRNIEQRCSNSGHRLGDDRECNIGPVLWTVGLKINKLDLSLKIQVNRPKNYRDHNQPGLHLLSTFGGSGLNGWWVMTWTNANGVNLYFQVKFDLEGQGQSPPKTVQTLNNLFCILCPNLLILAWTGDELWRGQVQGWFKHTTDAGNDNTRRPKRTWVIKNFPKVRSILSHICPYNGLVPFVMKVLRQLPQPIFYNVDRGKCIPKL